MSVFTNRITAAKEEANAYTTAVLGLLGDKVPFDVLENLMPELQNITDDLSDEQLRRPEAPGKWSILEVIHHLADSELVWAYRLRLVVAEDKPQLTGYDQDAWVKNLGYREGDLQHVLDKLRILRRDNLTLLRSLSQEQLQRVGVHSERGEESVAHLIRLYAGHDLVHLQQMERIKEGMN